MLDPALWAVWLLPGAGFGLLVAWGVLRGLDERVLPNLQRRRLFLLAAAVAGGASAPVVAMATFVDNTDAPTPAPLGALAMATPVLAVAGYRRLAPVGNVARGATLVAGLGLAAAAQLVVVADAYSCVDDDCLRLPVAARQLPFASTWVAAIALWSATRARRPAASPPPRLLGHLATAAIVTALVLSLWPSGVDGSYTIDPRAGPLDRFELNRCLVPLLDAFGHDDFASGFLPRTGTSHYGSVHCRPAAEHRLLWSTVFLVVGAAFAAGAVGDGRDGDPGSTPGRTVT